MSTVATPLAVLCIASVLAGSVLATDYRESVSGDISDNPLSPLALELTPGSNQIFGVFGPGTDPNGEVPDLDYVALTVPDGWRLSAMPVLDADVGGGASFIGVQKGSTFTVPWTTFDASPLYGWAHFYTSSVGEDLLPIMGQGFGAEGCSPPLAAGTYTFWIMELAGARPYSYGFDFIVTPCPSNVDGQGGVDFGDFLAFFNCYDTEQSCADVDGNPGVDFGDFLAFFNGYDAGC